MNCIEEKDSYSDESILYIVKENWDIFAPTFKEYAEKVMDKAIEEKKASIDRLEKMLEELKTKNNKNYERKRIND